MFTASWNTPIKAFTIENEFFQLHNEDEILLGVHKVNQFVGLDHISGYHFHEMGKDVTNEKIEMEKNHYPAYLKKIFENYNSKIVLKVRLILGS